MCRVLPDLSMSLIQTKRGVRDTLATSANTCSAIKPHDLSTGALVRPQPAVISFAPRNNAGAKADNGSSSAAVRREPQELKATLIKYELTRRRATAALESKQHAI